MCKDACAAVGDVIVKSRTVCAGATGLDACYGDSGGPMFATTPSGFPGTYTEVNARTVRTFISSTMANVR